VPGKQSAFEWPRTSTEHSHTDIGFVFLLFFSIDLNLLGASSRRWLPFFFGLKVTQAALPQCVSMGFSSIPDVAIGFFSSVQETEGFDL